MTAPPVRQCTLPGCDSEAVTLPTPNAEPLLAKDAAVLVEKADTSAASFWGGEHADEEAESGRSRASTEAPMDTSSGVSLPTSALPLGQLEALPPEKRRRLARQRGLDWPTTDEARDRLEDTIFDVIRHEDERVVDAPTSLGKSHTVATTRWGARKDVTAGQPIVHLLPTRDARDDAIEKAAEHGGEFLVLRSRDEACRVAAGDYDPEHVDEGEDREPITIDGQPASAWLRDMCEGRGIAFSDAHRHLEAHNDQGADMPCAGHGEHAGECDAIAQWDVYRDGPPDRDRWPLVIGTHNFAHVPGLRTNTNDSSLLRAETSVSSWRFLLPAH